MQNRRKYTNIALAIACSGVLLALFPELPDQFQIFGAVIAAISIGFVMYEYFLLSVIMNPFLEFRIRSEFKEHKLLRTLAEQHYDALLVLCHSNNDMY